ncbi:ethanolamine ammonia-lyase subunit EutB [bacterium]|nr:ethanolamine ammonia-lyase subunit EutB [bacterium]
MITRRSFLRSTAVGASSLSFGRLVRSESQTAATPGVTLSQPAPDDDIFRFIRRTKGRDDQRLYQQILGAANPFKEGDRTIGVAAADDTTRQRARTLLSRTRIADISATPPFHDKLYELLQRSFDRSAATETSRLTLGELKQFLLTSSEASLKAVMSGLPSDVIGCVVKLLSNDELIAVGANVFNPLPGSRIGARGYLGARIQPNSPTDNTQDIFWQVLDGWSYAVGDVVLGNNPVSSDPRSVRAIEETLRDLLVTFGIDDLLPHCVLAHIDVQSDVERTWPASTALWFQSIAGCDSANATFDISVDKMLRYADQRTGPYGLYFETGQGADFTNGHSHGVDMVLHESRKYGFARALTQRVAAAQQRIGSDRRPWVHLNDVAGFIGPEVFRSREQLVRCCLEDIVMGKLHGLTIGLDVCSTLHMDVSLDDLDWCLDQIMPANPAYLMALPTKIDPMLGYLTTGFQDHVRLREKFGYRVNDAMWQFFQRLEVIDEAGMPTAHFGDPLWIYLQYRRRRNDSRSDEAILDEGRSQIATVRSRGVFLVEGHGGRVWDLPPQTQADISRIYVDAKKSIWAELDADFVDSIPGVKKLHTQSNDRTDYILHPETGERLAGISLQSLRSLKQQHAGQYDVQIVVSDGLNALATGNPGQLLPFLQRLRDHLQLAGRSTAPEHLVVTSGRVRAGYRIGETLFSGLPGRRSILHVIGERPGTGHHTFSVYITTADGTVWSQTGTVDHNITKVVSGIATTAFTPAPAAEETARVLKTLG